MVWLGLCHINTCRLFNGNFWYIYHHHHHHHHQVALPANISLTLSLSLSHSLSPSIPIIYCSRQVYQTTSCVRAEWLWVITCRSTNTSTNLWRGPLNNITYEFFLAYPAVSHMSYSSYLDVFSRWKVSGHTADVSWSVASRICSLYLVIFLCCSSQYFSLCVLSASMRCIYRVVLTKPPHESNPVLFYRIYQTSIWPIAY